MNRFPSGVRKDIAGAIMKECVMTVSNPLRSRENDQRIPPEAREGLMRAWLAILRERHPNVTWVAVESPPDGDREDAGPAQP